MNPFPSAFTLSPFFHPASEHLRPFFRLATVRLSRMSDPIDRKHDHEDKFDVDSGSDIIAPVVAPSAPVGVVKIASASRVWGRVSLAILYLGYVPLSFASSIALAFSFPSSCRILNF